MARDTTDQTPLSSKEELIAYLADGCKPAGAFRIGTEHEKFAFFQEDNSPVPYAGERSIATVLESMRDRLGWEPILDDGNIIGLVEPNGQGAISLEPGGQFELSGAPLENIHDTCRESNTHLALLQEIAEPLGIGFLGLGGSPKWTRAQTPRMPKQRYDIMTAYMPKVGKQGLDMMYRTCTIQVNLDFSSETDMRRKVQLGMKLQPLATALFALSPFTEGQPNGLLSWRSDIWRDTDPHRTGILPFVFADDFGFEDYVDWALDVPMYFILREGHYHDCTYVTFRQFMNGALKDDVPDGYATMGDWTNHLSTLFPEVRLKRFIEMRGADGGPWRRICALPAFWVGLLYDNASLDAVGALTRDWHLDAVQALRDSVPRLGLDAEINGLSLHRIAREVLGISRAGLQARGRLNEDGNDEAHFLAPLEETVARGKTAAGELLDLYHGRWNRSVDPVFQEYAY